ncbi:MAG: penicillin-binding protein 2 [Glaciecola sp.]|jgi:penicillin-binding protein 2
MSMANNDASPTLRLAFLAALCITFLAALTVRLWFLQVLAGERFAAEAEDNRIRELLLEAPRGRILDANGQELVKNRPAQTISADRRLLINGIGEPIDDEADAVLSRLGLLLRIDREEIVRRLTSRRYSPLRPVPIAEDVSAEVIFAVSEHAELFHGVVAETLPVRTYPFGETGAHLVGFLGEISEDELDQARYDDYRQGELIGWAGLERTYQDQLRGETGTRLLQVNARGVVLDVAGEIAPIRGNDLLTSIDIDLQADVESILEEGILASRFIQRTDGRFLPSVAGSAVVIDPRNGAVRAIASWPTFDPGEFVGGVSRDYWGFLQETENRYPLINRAIQSAYPPGSVFKIVSGAVALEAELITPASRISCPPSWKLSDTTFRNWNSRHEGALNLSDALMRSCDTFFYELAYQQWVREQRELAAVGTATELLPEVAARFGMGRTLGVDLPVERAGTIPGRAWRESYWENNRDVYCRKGEELEAGTYAQLVNQDLCIDGGRWRGGDAVNSSIGQGDVLTTPLQVAAAYAAIANGGTLFQPHVGDSLLAPDGSLVTQIEPVVLGTLGLDQVQMQAIKKGLEDVVMAPRGTARGAFAGFPLGTIPVAGKTGTAELKPKVPYAWFATYAPVGNPEWVVVVSVEQGGGGSQTAAPIARRIYEAIFELDRTPFAAGPGNLD